MDSPTRIESGAEVERLRRVYRGYAARRFGDSKWSPANRGNRAILAERRGSMRRLLEDAGWLPLGGRRVLEVGCGTGSQLEALAAWGGVRSDLFGIDLVPERIRVARRMYPGIHFQAANAEALPFADAVFDLAAVFTVFTSILCATMRCNVAREIGRILRPGGAVIWYDFRVNNPGNRHVRGISRREIKRLFPEFAMRLETVSLLPPLARRLGALTRLCYRPLGSLPFLRTHYLGLLTKP